MKRRLMAVLLALVMTLSLLPISALAAEDPGISFSKSVKQNDDGTYTITMEAYATGKTTTTTTKQALDIALVLDVSGSMDKSFGKGPQQQKKLTALKNAVNNFIDGVAANSPESNISIVKFAGDMSDEIGNDTYRDGRYTYNYTQIVKQLTAVKTGKDELKTAVSSLTAAGATAADYGMEKAEAALATAQNPKVIVMFTDGEPNHDNGFDYEVATSVINKAKTLKAAGTTIYTVGVFEKTNTENDRYMSSTSSNYPNASAKAGKRNWTVSNGGTDKGRYYKTASSASDLNNIFTEISQEISSAANAKLNDKTTVVDTISDYFTLAADGTSSVKVYTANKTADGWADAVEAPESVQVSVSDKTVSVTGYNYAANYVHDGQGQKLIIEITVVPSGIGCKTATIPTNADSSTTGHAAKVMLDGEEITSASSATVDGHAVVYDLAGGEKQSDFPTLYYPEYAEVSVTDKEPTKQDYNFTGWNRGDASVSGKLVMQDEDIILVAQWEKKTIDDEIVVKVTGNTATLPYNGGEQSVSGYDIKITKDSADHPYSLDYVSGPEQTVAAKGTDKGDYSMGLKAENFQNTNLDYTNVTFIVNDGSLTITPKDVTFTGKSDSKQWTGEEQEITDITVEGLLEGDTYEGLSYSAKGTNSGTYDGVFSGTPVIKNEAGEDVTGNYSVKLVPGKLTITDKIERVVVTFEIKNGTWADGTKGPKTAYVSLTNGKGTLDEDQVPTGMKPDAGYTNGTWDVTPNTAENAITGAVTYIYSYSEIIPASFNPTGYIVKQMTGDEMPNEETFTVNVALAGSASMNGTATLRTGTANFQFPEDGSFSISEDTIFMVAEDEGSAARVTYDDNVYQLKVTVKPSEDGLSMEIDTVSYSADGESWHDIDTTDTGDKLVFFNSYTEATPASFNPNGYIVKQMTGDEMPNEETFTVNVAPDGSAGMNGTATLRTGTADFQFPENGSFSISEDTIFMVAEDEGSAARVTYDDNVYQLKVTVKPSEDGLSMEIDTVSYSADGESWHDIDATDTGDKLVFFNSYTEATPASFNPTGYIVKQMTGDEMPNEETFTVNVALDGSAGMNGTATLRTGTADFQFPENGSFSISEDTIFMVAEDEGSAARVTYDDNVYQLKVTVKPSEDGLSMEIDTVSYSADGKEWHDIDATDTGDKLVFFNSYEAEIIPDAITVDLSEYIKKELTLTGDNRFTGATYTATVTPIIDGELGEAKTISVSYAANESGLKAFNGTLTFTESGIYRYEVKEVIPANATGYDTSVYELLVMVDAEDGVLVATVGHRPAGDQPGELVAEPIVFRNTYDTGKGTIIIPPEQRPTLNTDDHYAYVMGYPDGTVRPTGNITRAEVATIFFRLLTDESRNQFWSTTNTYSDVKRGDWFNNAVSTLSNAGIISGYPDGTFRPNAPITRAEMAKVIALFAKLDKSEDRFNDIAGHWAEAYIRLAAGNGWIAGYPDGSFKPQQNITRAETMTMINRVLDRVPSVESHLLPYNVMLTFPDCQSGQWYYIAVQEATNSHTYERAVTEKNGDEQWIALRDNRDWTEFEH